MNSSTKKFKEALARRGGVNSGFSVPSPVQIASSHSAALRQSMQKVATPLLGLSDGERSTRDAGVRAAYTQRLADEYRNTRDAGVRQSYADRVNSERLSELRTQHQQATVDMDVDKVAELKDQITALEKSMDQHWTDRVGNAASGMSKQWVGGLGSGVATGLQSAQDNSAARFEQKYELQKKRYEKMLTDNKAKPGTWSETQLSVARKDMEMAESLAKSGRKAAKYSKVTQGLNKFRESTSKLSESGAMDIEAAKKGLTGAGAFAVDVGVGIGQLAMDIVTGAAITAATGGAAGGAMIPLALRSFGSAADTAMAEGATLDQQAAYGAMSAMAEVVAEKISSVGNVFTKAFGKGAADDVLEGAIAAFARLDKNPATSRVLNKLATGGVNFVSEAFEEGFSSIIDPALKNITYTDGEKIDWNEVFYEALVGGVIGSIAGGAGGTDTTNADLGHDIRVNGKINSLFETALQAPENSEAYRLADKIRSHKGSATDVELGQLRIAVNQQLRKEYVDRQISEQMAKSADLGSPVVSETATTLDRGTSLYLNAGLVQKPKKAEAKAKLIQDLIDGKKVDDETLKALNLTNAKFQAVFTELTGVTFEGAKTREQIFARARAAHQVAQERKQVEKAIAASQEAAEAAEPTTDKERRLKKGYDQQRNIVSRESPERQAYLREKYEQHQTELEALEVGDHLVDDAGNIVGVVVDKSPWGITVVGDAFMERIPVGTFADDGVISFLETGAGHFERGETTAVAEVAEAAEAARLEAPEGVDTTPTESPVQAAQEAAVEGLVAEDARIPTFEEFSERYRAQHGDLAPEQMREAYDQFVAFENETVTDEAGTHTRMQFRSAMKAENPELSDPAIDQLFGLYQKDAALKAERASKAKKSAEEGSEKKDLRYKLSKDVQNVIAAFEKKLGVKIYVGDEVIEVEVTDPETGKKYTRYAEGEHRRGFIRLNMNSRADLSYDEAVLQLLRHEMTHFLQAASPDTYKKFRAFVVENMPDYQSVFDRQAAKYAGVIDESRKNEIDDEVVAKYMEKLFDDKEFVKLLAEKEPNLLEWLIEQFSILISKLTGKELSDARSVAEQTRDMWESMLHEVEQKHSKGEIKQGREVTVVDDGSQFSISSLSDAMGVQASKDENGHITFTVNGTSVSRITVDHIRNESGIGLLIKTAVDNGFISADDAEKQFSAAAELMNTIIRTEDPGMVWAYAGATMFSALKSNADGQYGTTVDFTTVCRKTQDMVSAMSHAMVSMKRGLTKEEITQLQAELIAEDSPVPCPVCYVFSRWAGVGSILDNMYRWQNTYENYTPEQIETRIAELRRVIGDKTDLKQLLREQDEAYFNLAMEKERNEQQIKDLREAKKRKDVKKDKARVAAINDQISKLQTRNKEIPPALKKIEDSVAPELAWLQDVRADPEYAEKGHVEPDILFNMDAGDRFASQYPLAWGYRTSRGPSAGKAIVPYSDMVLGDLIGGLKNTASDGKTTFKGAKGELTKDQKDAVVKALARTRAQNLIGGQRFQSTSDFRYEYALDYIQAFWELQAIGSNVQTYTKIVEFAELIASVGGDVNLSVMPRDKGYEDGHLIYSNVTGVDVEGAMKVAQMFDNAQLILVGVNDEHIRLALEDSEKTGGIHIGFVIPYHASGASDTFISALVQNLGEVYAAKTYTDYSKVQTDSALEKTTPDMVRRHNLRDKLLKGKQTVNLPNGKKGSRDWAPTDEDIRFMQRDADKAVDITGRSFEELREVEKRALSGNAEAIREYKSWTSDVLWNLYQKMWNGGSENGVRLNSAQAKSIMPHEYWNKTVNRQQAYINGFLFRSYCYNLGLKPRFTGITIDGEYIGDFSDSKGYWKTLIDRPMYANDGSYRDQQKINATNFNQGMLTSDYGETHWGEYKVAEPDLNRAQRAAENWMRNKNADTAVTGDGQSQFSFADEHSGITDEASLSAVERGDSSNEDIRYAIAGDAEPTLDSLRLPAEVIFGARYSELKTNGDIEDYNKAKTGDVEAAFRLIQKYVTEEDVAKIANFGGHVYLLPVQNEAGKSDNVIPLTLGSYISAATGQPLLTGVYQSDYLNRRRQSSTSRMSAPDVEFDTADEEVYNILKGAEVIGIDDNTSYGSTLRGLAKFLQAHEAEMVGSYVLTVGGDNSEAMVVTNRTWAAIEREGVENVEQYAREHGYSDAFDREHLGERRAQDFLTLYQKNKGGGNRSGRKEPGTTGANQTVYGGQQSAPQAMSRAEIEVNQADQASEDSGAFSFPEEPQLSLADDLTPELREEFVKSFDAQFGEGAAEAMFKTHEQMVRTARRAFARADTNPPAVPASQADDGMVGWVIYKDARSIGSAALGFDPYSYLQNEYGTIEQTGKNNHRVADVPKSTNGRNKVSKTASTVMGAKATPDARLGDIAQAVVDGDLSYYPTKNKIAENKARARIRKIGYKEAMSEWTESVDRGRMNSDLVAMGATLLNNAGNSDMSGREYARVLAKYAQLLRSAGQILQAANIFKKMSPQAKLYNVVREVEEINSRRDTGLPVSMWMDEVGELLADEIYKRIDVKEPRARVKSVADTILDDLKKYAGELVARESVSGATPARTELERLQDMFRNKDKYEEAWQIAKNRLVDEFGAEANMYAALEAWVNSELTVADKLTKILTKQNEIVMDEALAEEYLAAETEEAREEIMDRILQNIADQIPATGMDKFTALRYIGMLGNLRTNVRNVAGNSLMVPIRMTKTVFSGLAQALIQKAGVDIDRTTSLKRDRETLKAAKAEFEKVKDIIAGGGKYQDNHTDISQEIRKRQRIFKNAYLEGLRKGSGWLMENEYFGDAAFSSFAFSDSLSRYIAANGTTWSQASDELKGKALEHAVREAAEATFRDNNALSEAVSKIRFRNPKNWAEKGLNLVTEGILPFRKTPANVLMRALEYSPIGLTGAMVNTVRKAANKSDVTAADLIDSFAKGLTGSAIVAIGMALADSGILKGSGPDDEKEKELWEMQGHQKYSLEIGGTSYTIDWASPISIPLLVGAELQEALLSEGLSLREATGVVSAIFDPLLEMSMLQGINDAISNAQTYGDESALVRFVGNALWSYVTQPIPTLLGQIERSGSNTRMTTYVDKNKDLPDAVQRALGKASAKIPVWDYAQVEFIDAWGRTQANADSATLNVIEQFLSPGYANAIVDTDMEDELLRLHQVTGDSAVLISSAPKYFNVGKQRKDLTADEYLVYAKTRGQTAFSIVSDLTSSSSYTGLTDKQKADAVKKVYDFSNQIAKEIVTDGKSAPEKWVTEAQRGVIEYGIPMSTYALAYAATKDIESVKDGKGETVDNSKSLRVLVTLYELPGLSDEQVRKLAEDFGVNESVRKYSAKMAQSKLAAMEKRYG